jgi:hypothetical protein
VGLSAEPMEGLERRISAATAPPLTPPRKSGEGNSPRPYFGIGSTVTVDEPAGGAVPNHFS